MLILTRDPGQELIIDVDGTVIKVKVLTIKGRQVQIGIEADKEIIVDRAEIYKKRKGIEEI